MRAAVRTGLLGYSLTFKTDHAVPTFSPSKNKDDVFIQVKAAALNPVDYKFPRALGGPVYGKDVCGTVVKVGSNVSKFAVGDTVYGHASTGSLAEQAICASNKIAKVDGDDWKPTELAALPVAYVTGLQSLKTAGITPDTASNKSLLVIGASGGCGYAGIQLAKAMGASRIVGICSGKNADFVKSAGATEVVDYTDTTALENFFKENKGKLDCVYDTATGSGGGEDYWEKSHSLLKQSEDGSVEGYYVALNGPPSKWMRKLSGTERAHQTITMLDFNGADLEEVVSLLTKSGAKPHLNPMSFSEEGVQDGFEQLKSRRTKGKIVFSME